MSGNPSTKLREAVARARAALDRDPRGDLLRGYRESVWAALAGSDDGGRTCRARLAIAAARRVLPALKNDPAADAIAREVLQLAERVLSGLEDEKDVRGRYDTAIVEMDDISNVSGDRLSIGAGYAAVQALAVVIHDEAFDPCAIDLQLTDNDTDPDDRDSGYFAAAVAAGGPPWDPTSDAAARRSFWEWWLAEALRAGQRTAP